MVLSVGSTNASHSLLTSSLWLLFVSAALSALIPNIPLVVALTPLLLAACQHNGLLQDNGVPMQAALPLFESLMLGVVIGGSATMIGSSSNLVASGVARQHGGRFGFRGWLAYGLPTVSWQLMVASCWCWFTSC
jgi:Na+/H+ antiporter NhaD/arsenite permease-like protein